MPEQENCARVQDDLITISAKLNRLAYRLHRLRDGLQLPPDALEIYESELPWPVELEIDAAIGMVIDDCLDVAADRLREAARASEENLRHRNRAAHRSRTRQTSVTCGCGIKAEKDSN